MKNVLMILSMLLVGTANAAVINIAADDSSLQLGQSTTVTVSGIFADPAEAFDNFNFAVEFNTSALQVVPASISLGLPNDMDSFYEVVAGDFGVGAAMFSFVDFSGDITFLSFDVMAREVGQFDLMVAIEAFFDVDDAGSDIQFDFIPSTSLTVTEASLPPALGLFIIAGAALLRRRTCSK